MITTKNRVNIAVKSINIAMKMIKASQHLNHTKANQYVSDACERLVNIVYNFDSQNRYTFDKDTLITMCDTLNLRDDLGARDELSSNELFCDTPKKEKVVKHSEDELAKARCSIVRMKKNSIRFHILNQNELLKFAKLLKKAVQFEPYANQVIAHHFTDSKNLKGEGVDLALMGLCNYAIAHQQEQVLKRNNIAQAKSVYLALYLFSSQTQKRIKKQLKQMGSIDSFTNYIEMVKVNLVGNNLKSVSRPTVKDVDKIVKELH